MDSNQNLKDFDSRNGVNLDDMDKQRTLVFVKPDGVERGLVGEIIKRFENRGIKIIGMKMVWPDKELAEKHYREDIAEKYGEKIRNDLIKYLIDGPVIAMILEGAEVIRIVRSTVGDTYPGESEPGTIRGDFCHITKEYANANNLMIKNTVHASGNEGDAKIEIPLWFEDKELHNYKRADEKQILG